METGKIDGLGLDVKLLNQQTLREFGMAAKRAGSVTSGFASRETSPERTSIASYRVGSRPGTAQTYSAADVKKQYAGGSSLSSCNVARLDTQLNKPCFVCSWSKIFCFKQCQKARTRNWRRRSADV